MSELTPTEKLMQMALYKYDGSMVVDPVEVRNRYADLTELDDHWDIIAELRGSGVPTGLLAPHSRHYESKAVAAEMLDGSWVGWTYWYGGGKHGEPEAIPWMEDAYEVTPWEETQVVRKFKITGE